jgi:hypothetical protein
MACLDRRQSDRGEAGRRRLLPQQAQEETPIAVDGPERNERKDAPAAFAKNEAEEAV